MNGSSMMSLVSSRSPPPCGEGLGVGVVVCRVGLSPSMDPPPQPSPTRGEGGLSSLRSRTLALITTLVTLALTTPSHTQGFSGLGADAGGFAQVVPNKPLVFPADHGAHPDYRIEWWYLTANLKDAQGQSYGV